MESGREFLLAVRESTDAAFEEFGDDAGDFLDRLIAYISKAADGQGLTGARRDKVIFYEGMLRGVQTQFVRKKMEAQEQAHKLGIDLFGNKEGN